MTDVIAAGLGLTAGVVLVLAGLTIGVRHRWVDGSASLAATVGLLGCAGVAFGLQDVWAGAHLLRSLFLLASGVASLAFASTVERPPRELRAVIVAAMVAAVAVVTFAHEPGTSSDAVAVAVVLLAWGPCVAWASLTLYRRAKDRRSLQAFRLRAVASGLVMSVVASGVWLATTLLPVPPGAALRAVVISEVVALCALTLVALPPRWLRTWMRRATASVERDVLRGLLSLPQGEVLYEHVLHLAIELAGVAGGCIALEDGTVLATTGDDEVTVVPDDWVGGEDVVRRDLDDVRELRLYPFSLGEQRAVLVLEVLKPAVTFAVLDSHRVARFVRTAAPYVERSLLHDELTAERARQQAVLEAVGSFGQGYLITDGDRVVDASPTIEAITGASREELSSIGDAVSLVRPVDRERVRLVLRRAAAEGRVTSTTAAFERPDGSIRLVELVARKLGGGPAGGLLTLIRDVTSTSRALELEGRRSRQLTALTHLATSVTGQLERSTLQHAIVTATHDVLAAPHVALVSRLADGRVDIVRSGPEHLALEREIPMRAVEVSSGMWSSGTLAHRDGVASIGLLTAGALEGVLLFASERDPAPLDDIDRTVIDHLASLCAHGLAAAARYEGEVGARERVEASHELQAGLLAAVAHDLRTPMHLIGGLCETLLTHGAQLEPERQQDLLERVRKTVDGTERLLEDLLDVERDALGLLDVETAEVVLIDFVSDMLGRLPEHLRERIAVDVPDSARAVLDPHRAERIVENLIINASKYAPPETSITIRAWGERSRAILAIEDEGPGVPPDEREAIFHAFQRLPGASARATGVGLGLYVVSVLCRAQGASVSVHDREGGGASFRVGFPAPRLANAV